MAKAPLILLVDDTPAILDVYDSDLVDAGFVVQFAYSGSDALQQARALRPDVIVMDLHMPDMDGIETAQ